MDLSGLITSGLLHDNSNYRLTVVLIKSDVITIVSYLYLQHDHFVLLFGTSDKTIQFP